MHLVASSGKFLRVKRRYPENFRFLGLCPLAPLTTRKCKNAPKWKTAQNWQKWPKMAQKWKTIKNKIGLWSPPMMFSDQKIWTPPKNGPKTARKWPKMRNRPKMGQKRIFSKSCNGPILKFWELTRTTKIKKMTLSFGMVLFFDLNRLPVPCELFKEVFLVFLFLSSRFGCGIKINVPKVISKGKVLPV